MHVTTYRGRRVDVESLERENDRGVDLLSEKVALLKQVGFSFQSGRCMQARSVQPQRSQSRVYHRSCPFDTVQATHNIKNEADSHLGLLDKMVRQLRRVL